MPGKTNLAVDPVPKSADASTVATFNPNGAPVLLIDVVPTPSCVVAFDLYYFGAADASPAGPATLANQDADHFGGWSPPDPLSALPTMKVWIVARMMPIDAPGVVERVTVPVFQPKTPNRIDDLHGTYACNIPSPAADVVKTIEVTFKA
jgi:hypothetical protein